MFVLDKQLHPRVENQLQPDHIDYRQMHMDFLIAELSSSELYPLLSKTFFIRLFS
jgi:hypothetical protein